MKLDDTQKQKITAWIAEGLKLSDIQKRIVTEFGLAPTYMETRFMVDDLKLVPIDPVRPKEDKLPMLSAPAPGAAGAGSAGAAPLPSISETGGESPVPGGAVTVSVDQVTRPGSLVSGTVRFSDGQTGTWYMDQMGRLGVAPTQQGYKPSAADVEAFQKQLEGELTRLGL